MKKALLLALLATAACDPGPNDRPCTFSITGDITASGTCSALNAEYDNDSLSSNYGWTKMVITGSGGGFTLDTELWFDQRPDFTLPAYADEAGSIIDVWDGGNDYYWNSATNYSFDVINSDWTMTLNGVERYDVEGTLVAPLIDGIGGVATITVHF